MIPWSLRQKPREGFTLGLAGAAALFLFHSVYSAYFPNPSGRVGMDYTYFLPRLLDGYFWLNANGFFAIPWFTPSFCGGLPAFANPQSVYYSITQFLTLFMDPMKSVYWTILIFELLGFLGFYFLLRIPFACGMMVSLLGGALFMFNGFYIHRLITGHLSYHAYMLIPWVCFFLLRPLPQEGRGKRARMAQDSIAAGMLLAYMVYSGMNSLGLPMIFSVMLAGAAHGAIFGRDGSFWLRLALAGAVGGMISAAKLSAMASFAHNFPRDFYPRLGIDDPFRMAWFMIQTIFFWPDSNLIRGARLFTEGKYYVMSFQYYEFSVSPGPLLILAAGAAAWARKRGAGPIAPSLTAGGKARLAFLLAILIMPAFLSYNFNIPAMDAMIKKVPILGSHGHYTTWFMIYIPFLIIASMRVLNGFREGMAKWALAGFCPLALAGQIWAHDMSFYQRQYYDYQPIVDSYYAAREGGYSPGIEEIRKYNRPAMRGWGANTAAPFGGDDYLTKNASQMLCYEPIFGYWREKFPLKPLKPGPAMALENGYFNLKNPACFLFPEENNCRPGDHFTRQDRDSAENFRKYKPFSFAQSARQSAANILSMAALIVSLGVIGVYPFFRRGE